MIDRYDAGMGEDSLRLAVMFTSLALMVDRECRDGAVFAVRRGPSRRPRYCVTVGDEERWFTDSGAAAVHLLLSTGRLTRATRARMLALVTASD